MPYGIAAKKSSFQPDKERRSAQRAILSGLLRCERLGTDIVEARAALSMELTTSHAFDYAERMGRKRVTLVHKANIMKVSDGLFLDVFRRVARGHPRIEPAEMIVDACDDRAVHRRALQRHRSRLIRCVPDAVHEDVHADAVATRTGSPSSCRAQAIVQAGLPSACRQRAIVEVGFPSACRQSA